MIHWMEKYEGNGRIQRLFRREARLCLAASRAEEEWIGADADLWEAEERGEASTTDENERAARAKVSADAASGAHMVSVWGLFDKLNRGKR